MLYHITASVEVMTIKAITLIKMDTNYYRTRVSLYENLIHTSNCSLGEGAGAPLVFSVSAAEDLTI